MAKKADKKSETVRQKAAKPSVEKKRRLRNAASSLKRPGGAIKRAAKKEVYLPMPNNKTGRFLNKRRYLMPKYFREASSELRQVVWPDRKQTIQLTIAVFIFSIFFGVTISLVDKGLDEIFEALIIK